MTAPPDLDAIEALVGELDDAAYDHGEKILGDSRAFTGAKQGRGDARTALLTAIRLALTARDERIAALESRCATLRSLVNVRGGDEAIEQIAARVDADLARRAAEWEQMADDLGAANVEASARIAALEAELARSEARADRLYRDRYALLNLKTTEGMSAAEWQMRTADAEQKRKDGEARIAALESGLREMADRLRALADEEAGA